MTISKYLKMTAFVVACIGSGSYILAPGMEDQIVDENSVAKAKENLRIEKRKALQAEEIVERLRARAQDENNRRFLLTQDKAVDYTIDELNKNDDVRMQEHRQMISDDKEAFNDDLSRNHYNVSLFDPVNSIAELNTSLTKYVNNPKGESKAYETGLINKANALEKAINEKLKKAQDEAGGTEADQSRVSFWDSMVEKLKNFRDDMKESFVKHAAKLSKRMSGGSGQVNLADFNALVPRVGNIDGATVVDNPAAKNPAARGAAARKALNSDENPNEDDVEMKEDPDKYLL